VFEAERTYASRVSTIKRLARRNAMVCMSKLASLGVGAVILGASLNVYATDPPQRDDAKPPRMLDLKAPAISKIFTPQQIEMILARASEPELEHVEVEASRIADVPFIDRSASAPESVFKEVVRWFTPYPTLLAGQVNASPDATDPQRAPPMLLSSYHPSFPAPYSQR
jgi:hypothetical protein